MPRIHNKHKYPQHHKGIAGIGYYEELPEGWRKATIKDFYFDNSLLVGVAYLLEDNSGLFETYRTRAVSIRENISIIKQFIALGRCYVVDK